MKTKQLFTYVVLPLVILLAVSQTAAAQEVDVIGLWQYEGIITQDTQSTTEANGADSSPGVLLSDLETMPLDLLSKVFGKLSYWAAFTQDHRFEIMIKVLGMSFNAQGEWSVHDDRMTLIYDKITGFEKLWWLGGFDHLTHCDAEHTLAETVVYSVTEDKLTFLSNGAKLVFTR